MTEWLNSDSDDHLHMLATDYEITTLSCLVDDYATVVEGLNVSLDSSEVCCKIFLGCVRYYFDCIIFSTSLDFGEFFLWAYLGGDGFFWWTCPSVSRWQNIPRV